MNARLQLGWRAATLFASALLLGGSLVACSGTSGGGGGGGGGGKGGLLGGTGGSGGGGAGGSGGPSSDGGAGTGTSSGGTCEQPGSSCSQTSDCCQSGSGVPYGAACISNDNSCHALCTASSECNSGCCIELQNESFGVCGDYQSGYTCL